MKNLAVILLLTGIKLVISPLGTCNPACGGNAKKDCADFDDEESSNQKCYTCAGGYIGGTGGKIDGKGAPCIAGQCQPACSACLNKDTIKECYLCSFKYFEKSFFLQL